MAGFFEPLSALLSPNTTKRDYLFVLKQLLNPFSRLHWFRGPAVEQFHEWFQKMFPVEHVYSFDSGRSALHAVLQACGIQSGDTVILQAFTCIAVPNSILATGATPLYVDIDDSYNIDPEKLEALLLQHSDVKAVIVQHTFGQPADIVTIQSICKRFNVFLIEDCAHALGATAHKKYVGTFGDAAIFSFGRDKVLSTVSGGVAIATNPTIGAALQAIWASSPLPSYRWIAQRLHHPLILLFAKKTYTLFSFGKMILYTAKRLHLLPLAVTAEERKTEQVFVQQFPAVLAQWALLQCERLEDYNAHRQELAALYAETFSTQSIHAHTTPIYLVYAVEIPDAARISAALRAHHILLGNWYDAVITPLDRSLESLHYTPGMAPRAEQTAGHMVNFPTNINTSLADAKQIITLFRSLL